VIDFRYHLVSIVAVFLALAIGIVLGSTELQGPTYNFLNRTTATLQNELDQASSQRDAAQAEAAVGEAYAQAVQPVVLHNLLAGQRLLIITEPGAPGSVVSAITAAATADAGATVTGQVALQQKFFDTSDTTLDALNQINLAMAPNAGIQLDNGTSYQEQAAQVIASEILTKSAGSSDLQQTGTPSVGTTTGSTPSAGTGSQQGTNAQTMLAAYANTGFLTTSGQPYTQATLAVIVTPQDVPADGSADPLDQVLVSLAGQMAAQDSGTVVTGTSASSGPGSPIAFLRSNNVANQVSTVDDADLVSGQSVVIQALAVLLNGGKAGSYGFAANGATAVAPSPAPTPSVSASPSPSSSPTSKKKVK
jgi:Copper transport outer membrane protein, MctB